MKLDTNKITLDCLTILQLRGWMAWRQNNHPTPRRKGGQLVGLNKFPKGSRRGVPDIIAIEPDRGRFWGIEIKNHGDRMSEDQVRFREDVEAMGGVYVAVGSASELFNQLTNATL